MNEQRRQRVETETTASHPRRREESAAAQTSRRDKRRSTAELLRDHLINGTLASEDRGL
jgi:hypothetical protein